MSSFTCTKSPLGGGDQATRVPGKKQSFNLENPEKKKTQKSLPTDKRWPNRQLVRLRNSEFPPWWWKYVFKYGKNTANTYADPQKFFLELFFFASPGGRTGISFFLDF